MSLPIEQILPELKRSLQDGRSAVLVASPGAGKTTRVPLALLNEAWLDGRKIVMLEPRRMAARAAARYMAASLGEQTGETVGYRVRMDTKVGPNTRIEVVTEGVLTRLLQNDPTLEGVGLVIFDEFHERSLQADLGLALCLQSRMLLRDDLRLLIMSATLDAEPIAALLSEPQHEVSQYEETQYEESQHHVTVPILKSEGRAYPVETIYVPQQKQERMEQAVVRTIVQVLEADQGELAEKGDLAKKSDFTDQGDVLVFLPGAGEIRQVEALLTKMKLASKLASSVMICPLHGSMAQEDQDRAIAPTPAGKRKIVLSTSIAETSLTVEGVRIVIDSGLMRVPRYSPRSGLTRLETIRLSLAAADQRRGRAGRQGPGVCYRLWSERETDTLVRNRVPEIKEADLTSLVLELAAWGVAHPEELKWLDIPPAGAYAQAKSLLIGLGALDVEGRSTAHGRKMAELGLHPRLAHMILQSIPLGYGGVACEIAAMLHERDLIRGLGYAPDADLHVRLEALQQFKKGDDNRENQLLMPWGYTIDRNSCRQTIRQAQEWSRTLGLPRQEEQGDGAAGFAGTIRLVDPIGILLAYAYPDRIAQRRADGRYLLSGGRGAFFTGEQSLSNHPYLVVAELDDQTVEGRIIRAASITLDELELYFRDMINEDTKIEWDQTTQRVYARKRRVLGALLLQEIPVADPDPQMITEGLLKGLAKTGMDNLPWMRASRQLQQRMVFIHRHLPEWPDVSDEFLLNTLQTWLEPYIIGCKSIEDIKRVVKLTEVFEAMLSWEQKQKLEQWAPSHVVVPSGSRIAIDYSDPVHPVLAVRLQELFGMKETPRILGGKVPLTIHLLSPAQRPIQVTQDLASFWRTTYFEVKKDLKGRYPKHYWPDDPLDAIATQRVRPKQ